MTEEYYASKYKACSEVMNDECIMSGKNCRTCSHCREYDEEWNYFRSRYCLMAERKRERE